MRAVGAQQPVGADLHVVAEDARLVAAAVEDVGYVAHFRVRGGRELSRFEIDS